MAKTRIHHIFSRTLAVILLTASFHYQAPLANRAVDKQCCSDSEMTCCKGDIPGRTVCCIEHNEHNSANAAPIRAIPQSGHSVQNLLAPVFLLTQAYFPVLHTIHRTNISPHSALHQDNHLYLQLSSFLI